MNLNLPPYSFRIKETSGRQQIFDSIRKKFVALTPEEWVRQHLIRLLTEQYGVPVGLMAIEKPLKVGNLTQRADIIVYDRLANPILIVEVKSPSTVIDQFTLDQASRYNRALNVKYVILSNGMQHVVLNFIADRKGYIILDKMPHYKDLTTY